MSLFEQASLIVTPNATKAGKLYSIKPTDGAGDLAVVRATTATRVNSAGLIESVANNVPRLDYTNGSCPSILVEPQRTNLATYSEDFTNSSWNKITSGASVSTPIVTSNSAISPDGTMNADLIEFTPPSDSNFSICQKIISFNNSLSGSIYLKAFDESQVGKKVGIYIVRTGNVQGTVLTLTNEWQKVIISRPTDNYIEFTFGKGRTTWITGGITQSESASKFYAWGAQLEEGSNATSYIPTVATAVTRNADVISKTGISDLINSREGVLFANIKAISNPASTNSGISLTTGGNRIFFRFTTVANRINVIVIKDSVIQVNLNYDFFNNYATEFNKIALKYKDNDVSLYINGVKVLERLTCIMPDENSISGLLFADGAGGASVSQFFGNVNLVAVFPVALSDAELQQLTTL
jgi:hypothetical protein